MTALNKQALTDESARESGNILLIVAARMARRELFTPLHYVSGLPQKVVGMRVFREALEQCEEALQREVCRIVDGHNRMAKKLKEAEAKLEAAEKRIAELEANKGKPVMFIDGDISASDAEKLAAVIREWDDAPATVAPEEMEARTVTLPDVEKWRSVDAVRAQNAYKVLVSKVLAAAGIGVKGE
ncbi:hypothetical protein ACV6R0_000676 [Citrobacter freundii]